MAGVPGGHGTLDPAAEVRSLTGFATLVAPKGMITLTHMSMDSSRALDPFIVLNVLQRHELSIPQVTYPKVCISSALLQEHTQNTSLHFDFL